MYGIVKNIPRPSAVRPTPPPRESKYPFEDMEVGDMFFVPNKTKNTLSNYASIQGKRLDMKFSTRVLTMQKTSDGWRSCSDGDLGSIPGIGVWRTA
jgi:hypothetical protein